ncbi:mitochondrial import receptor subunit [Grosmannia clavigera kw1407]|uniref:Translocase of outer membrane 40 kDa subunit n=1 Tax=Grosmannia clavigera (strain kw1407 / UAMH 11150) TaxID=655863 RepID=F0XLS2_GROCL|nr:mitochondrial import receptor subunit [Grosmannia clavigera kw1407]EFX01055.1 mitochondrial import receptor subunit [Grosmannia clavigera kw1407]
MASADMWTFLQANPVAVSITEAWKSFSDRRDRLGLSNPGTVEAIAKEVQRDVLLNNHMFTGIKADLTKPFSVSPLFQVSHQFAMGDRLQPYTFAALYGTNKVFCQGHVDNEGQLAARFNYRWTDGLVSKSSAQLAPGDGQSMVQIEHEYTGRDFTASLKTMNPSYLDGGLTGIFIGNYLQSVTPKLSIGLEGVWQRGALSQPPDALLSYCGRYASGDWVATAQLQTQGAINATFWRRLAENVQAGVDMTLQVVPNAAAGLMGGGLQKEGVTTFGAKYDFRMSTFRAQLDSKGKLGVLLEKRVAAPVMMTFAADVDHASQQAKLGLGISIETGGEEMELNPDGSPVHAPPNNVPF